MLVAIVLALKGQQAFLLLYGTAVAAMFFVWTTILVTHIRFRQTLPPERVRKLPVQMPGNVGLSAFAILVIVALAASTAFVEGLEWTVPFFLVSLAVMTGFYFLRRR
jgi:L-asparagine transporter-like permease